MEDTVRKEAFYTLLDSGEYSSEKTDAALEKHQDWNERDRSFYMALVETTLENQTVIDDVISAYSRTRLAKMRPVVRTAVELALAQIFFMDRVPDSAACNESVKLVKAGGEGRYTGFANGLIRNIIRNKGNIEARVVIGNTSIRLKHVQTGSDSQNSEQIASARPVWKVADPHNRSYEKSLNLSLTYSYPYWIVEHFEKSYGDAEKILKGLRAPRKTTALSKIPADELIEKLSEEGIKAHAFDDHAVVFEEGTHPAQTKEFRDGLFYIMDLSSMQPVYHAGHDDAGRRDTVHFPEHADVLDLCASPGGKSIEAAVLYDARVISCDISAGKTARIQENIDRLGLNDHITVMKNDATVYNPDFEGKYDVVIADVPCSALGVSGRKPDIRQRVTQQSMQDLAAIQRQILDNASRYVKPGGTIIYSTCTLDPLENEQHVSAFLTASTEFTSVRQETIYPDADHDGFFYAILSKR
ncbi:MAG: transcription antitermination factor NusB [Lachnospiraceae bacterium]|nr:transcription antitermination factor NusB [Lachnospiraceae bacterium]